MHCLRVMIEAYTHDQTGPELFPQAQQRGFVPPHRLHRIAEDQDLVPTAERIFQHQGEGRVHERLPSRKADLAHVLSPNFDLVQIIRHLLGCDVDQRVIGRTAFDIAARTGQVAQGSGIEPQRVQPGQRHRGAGAAVRRHLRIPELAGFQRSSVLRPEGRRAFGQFAASAAGTHPVGNCIHPHIRRVFATSADHLRGAAPNTAGSQAENAAALAISLRVG